MHHELLKFFGLTITGWKLVGYLGTLMFTGRWILQMVASRRAGKSVMPKAFWYMSLSGSTLLLLYFCVGKPDSVGFLSNSFPAFISAYNLYLVVKHEKQTQQTTAPALAPAHVEGEFPENA